MNESAEPREVLVFGELELRPESGELRRRGEPVHLQQQPTLVLELLARHPGRTVSREEIREQIWGRNTFVDSEQGINYCIRQIRVALEDSAGEPRFVETVPRRGYRFIAPVERRTEEPTAAVSTASARPGGRSLGRALRRAGPRWLIPVTLGALAIVAVVVTLVVASSGREPSSGVAAVRPVIVPEEAHFRYLKARHLLDRIDSEEPVAAATESIELLRVALEEAPEYAPARAALAGAWIYRLDVPRSEALTNAEQQARTALALDPDDVDATFLQAVVLSAGGRHEEAIATARHAIELDPGHLPDVSLGWFYFFAHRFDEAIREAERVLEIAPLDEPNHQVLMLAALETGDEKRADREMGRYLMERAVAKRSTHSSRTGCV